MFKSSFFKNNREKLREKFDSNSLFAFTANGLQQRSGSTAHPLKQDCNFWYLSGIEQPDVLLVMHSGEEYLILPRHGDVFEKFHGGISKEELAQTSGVKNIYNYEKGLSKLKKLVSGFANVITCLPLDEYVEEGGFYSNPSRKRLVSLIKSTNDKIKLVDARTQLAVLRMTKEKEEIDAIEQAISITISAFKTVKSGINRYDTELKLKSAITTEFLGQGASGHAYDAIVASGGNACILHHLPKDTALEPGKLVLIDAGAEFMNYASDITRTYALSQPTRRQVEVYDTVMNIRNFALSLLKPGILFKDYERSVKEYSDKVINKLNLRSSGSSYYPHATSHFLGLDVHDAADYEASLQPNMVITLEPGIYIEKEDIGIRVEDDILITENGYRNLSEHLPRELI